MKSKESLCYLLMGFDLQGVPIVAGLGPNGPKAPKQRLVHLDLKGAPPKVSCDVRHIRCRTISTSSFSSALLRYRQIDQLLEANTAHAQVTWSHWLAHRI